MPSPQETDSSRGDAFRPADPFTSLTNFIDECISYTLQSVIGLPSSKEDMRTWKPWEELQRGNNSPWGWGNEEKCKHQDSDSKAPEQNAGTFQTDNYNAFGLSSATRTDDGTSDDIERCSPSQALSRLGRFLAFSPYSPTNLEENPNLQPLKENWRAAFTDLMNETQGGVLPYLTQETHLTTRRLNADTWRSFFLMNFGYNYHINAIRRELTPRTATSLLDPLSLAIYMRCAERMSSDIRKHEDLYRRRIAAFHPELAEDADCEHEEQEFEHRNTHAPEDMEDYEGDSYDNYEDDHGGDFYENLSDDAEPATELGMLEALAGLFNEPPGPNQSATSSRDKVATSAEPDQRSIIGRLTSIERVVRADGTIETKRVLKTRFSDGSEDEESSSDVVHGQTQIKQNGALPHQPTKEPKSTSESRQATEVPREKNGGWFWKGRGN